MLSDHASLGFFWWHAAHSKVAAVLAPFTSQPLQRVLREALLLFCHMLSEYASSGVSLWHAAHSKVAGALARVTSQPLQRILREASLL